MFYKVRFLDCFFSWLNVDVLYIFSLILVLVLFLLKCFIGKGLKGFFIAKDVDLEWLGECTLLDYDIDFLVVGFVFSFGKNWGDFDFLGLNKDFEFELVKCLEVLDFIL